jgi:L-lactate dehydrogenase
MVRGVGKHISLFDVAKAQLNAEVLDLNHGLMFVPEVEEHAHNTHQEAASSDRRRDHNL